MSLLSVIGVGTGIDAIINGALDSRVKVVAGVPGFPITKIMESFLESSLEAEWSINEKVALELALGASVCGERSLVIVKHIGMNILADPLVTAPTHTIGAGVVIIAGDDPGARKSQNEQDSRYYGSLAEVPVFDPSTPQALYDSLLEAFRISEAASMPAIVRTTNRLNEAEGEIAQRKEKVAKVSFDRSTWSLTMQGKHQWFHSNSYPKICREAEESFLNQTWIRGRVGVISSGYPSFLVENLISGEFKELSHLILGVVNPLPLGLIASFIRRLERVLVVEETEPFVEERVKGKKILGKLTGHLPRGILEKEDIIRGLENINYDRIEIEVEPQTIESRGRRPLCGDCPYLPLYKALKELGVPIAGDLGCSILTAPPPMSLILTGYSLGSPISVASGFGKKGIALIGDHGLAHSGIQGLINAVYNRHDVLVVVLQNKVAAMTGGQEVPDLTKLVMAIVEDVSILEMGEEKDLRGILKEKLAGKGVSVVLAKATCNKFQEG